MENYESAKSSYNEVVLFLSEMTKEGYCDDIKKLVSEIASKKEVFYEKNSYLTAISNFISGKKRTSLDLEYKD